MSSTLPLKRRRGSPLGPRPAAPHRSASIFPATADIDVTPAIKQQAGAATSVAAAPQSARHRPQTLTPASNSSISFRGAGSPRPARPDISSPTQAAMKPALRLRKVRRVASVIRELTVKPSSLVDGGRPNQGPSSSIGCVATKLGVDHFAAIEYGASSGGGTQGDAALRSGQRRRNRQEPVRRRQALPALTNAPAHARR